ncbi:hypothetical protein EJ04DRAFT_192060 [Polyplosphaeria fusca]|uniref:Apple domain-containing protein n=1 Tax=Polyplosphaeria fusca TaxID=682080 RepID=A0A9P4QZ27_9PLEO|nr:hypothetical protein EJ04DRAFT_192060 [Polyplosphaeria fusca]
MMKAVLLAAALAACVNGGVIEARQRGRPTRGPDNGPPDVVGCGLDSFAGHTAEALLYCSALLQGGTYTTTATYTTRDTTTTRVTYTTTVQPTRRPPTSTPPPVTSAPPPPPSSTVRSSTSPPAPSGTANCGLVGYTKDTAAYYFDSSGTKNTFAACSSACKADSKCKSFGYGEANCMLFDISAVNNVNYNPMSPYTFYDSTCPAELPVKHKRQVNITVTGGPARQSSACSCLITSGKPDATRTVTATVSSRLTKTETVTRIITAA